MNIAIIGCGKIGGNLARELSFENHNITIIDIDENIINNYIETYDVAGISGNGASRYIQLEARVDEADLVIAVTGFDELNLLCSVIAKKTGAKYTIARVRNPEYYDSTGFLQKELSLSMIINPDMISAKEIYNNIRFPMNATIDAFANGKVELIHFKILENSPLINKSLMDISKDFNKDVLVTIVNRKDEIIIPTGSFTLLEGDKISVMLKTIDLDKFIEYAKLRIKNIKNLMIIGASKIAYYLCMLLKKKNIDIKVIEKDIKRANEFANQFENVTVINGDAYAKNLLLEEGITDMGAVINLTNMDEENIVFGLFAKSIVSKGKVISKINKTSFDQVVNNLDLGDIINPNTLSSNMIIQYVRALQNSYGSSIEKLYKLMDDRVEALEFRIKSKNRLTGIKLIDLKIKSETLIGCINRKGTIIIPSGNDTIEVGDTVIIVTTNKLFDDIEEILM